MKLRTLFKKAQLKKILQMPDDAPNNYIKELSFLIAIGKFLFKNITNVYFRKFV